METDELHIIKECRNGRPERFAVLYDRYVKKIYNFIYYRTHHKETAEDITSQVFLKAVRGIQSFRLEDSSFSAWLYTIARNAVIDHYRTEKKEYAIEDAWGLSGDEDIEGDVDARLKLQQVKKYLRTLEPHERELLLLRFWDELSYKEISEITGKTEAGLKMSVSRALRRLRQNLPALISLIFFFKFHIYE